MDNNVQGKKLRFNIIDFLIVCAVISIIVLFVFRSGIDKPYVENETSIRYTVVISGAQTQVMNFPSVDDIVYSQDGQTPIGKIVSKSFTPSQVYTVDLNGKIVKTERVGHVDVYLTIETDAVALDSGYEIDKDIFIISGEEISIRLDNLRLDATVIEVEEKL